MTSPSAGRGQTREEAGIISALGHHGIRVEPGHPLVDSLIMAAGVAAAPEVADLRSRLAAAEAEAAIANQGAKGWEQQSDDFARDLARLRAGIQALADEERLVSTSELRSLLSPANPQKDGDDA